MKGVVGEAMIKLKFRVEGYQKRNHVERHIHRETERMKWIWGYIGFLGTKTKLPKYGDIVQRWLPSWQLYSSSSAATC